MSHNPLCESLLTHALCTAAAPQYYDTTHYACQRDYELAMTSNELSRSVLQIRIDSLEFLKKYQEEQVSRLRAVDEERDAELVRLRTQLQDARSQWNDAHATAVKRNIEVGELKANIREHDEQLRQKDEKLRAHELQLIRTGDKMRVCEREAKHANYQLRAREREVEEMNEKLSARELELDQLKDRLRARDTEVQQLEDQARARDHEVQQANEQLHALKRELKPLEDRVRAREEKIKKLKDRLGACSAEVDHLNHQLHDHERKTHKMDTKLGELQDIEQRYLDTKAVSSFSQFAIIY